MMKKEIKEIKGREGFVRLLDTDIPANLTVYSGLTRIKGIGFSLANAICNYFDIDKHKRLYNLSEEEIKKINSFPNITDKFPSWLLNRGKDRTTSSNMHLLSSKLDLSKEFDIRRLKKIKCYRGIRHMFGQPVRGQRTKGHFRRKGGAVGVSKAKSKKR